jgi:hypothetical protein
LFTCAKQSQQNQAYASTGELCVNITDTTNTALTARCEDPECTLPRALAGFWRLDLDLKFACNNGADNIPVDPDTLVKTGLALSCQNPVAKGYVGNQGKVASLVDNNVATKTLDSVNPFQSATSEGVALCVAPTPGGGDATGSGEATTCPDPATQLRCDLRGQNAPPAGSCVFRRAKEARRALGSAFAPWASADQTTTVADLTGRCSSARYGHLLDPTIYDEYPQLKISPTCYDVVGCSPKDSCRGNNTCANGYEYNKYKCLQFNAQATPDQLSCQTDDECRSRSGVTTNGFGSACDLDHPEDCARCRLGPIDVVTGTRNGTCECVGGG